MRDNWLGGVEFASVLQFVFVFPNYLEYCWKIKKKMTSSKYHLDTTYYQKSLNWLRDDRSF